METHKKFNKNKNSKAEQSRAETKKTNGHAQTNRQEQTWQGRAEQSGTQKTNLTSQRFDNNKHGKAEQSRAEHTATWKTNGNSQSSTRTQTQQYRAEHSTTLIKPM
jgi:hypothetical protein